MTTTDAAAQKPQGSPPGPKLTGVAPEGQARVHSERRILTPEGVPLIFQLAQRGERAAAVMIDLVIMVIALVVFVVTIAFTLSEFGIEGVAIGMAILASFIIRNFYFIFFELRWQGQTPGKRALGIRVIDRKGGYLRPGAVFSRNLLREVELFLPLTLIFGVGLGGSSGWVYFLTLGWVALCLLLPFFNKDRLRAGDLVAGTWVVSSPKALLLDDVAAGARRDQGSAVVLDPEFPFTRSQLEIYGIYELQTLEEVLRQRGPQSGETRREVAKRIQRKIDWAHGDRAARNDIEAERFLKAFYAALRAHLEARMLFGERRENKYAGKPGGKTGPNGNGAPPGKT
ncbi:RDD family protein [Pelagibius marinus]|uniref:RDD family protein n=1 Tax=Pelagibius marinus TaxID=2762760 RepID=UPI001872296B|nr:RDD family protein [Pelagibius marinus]